jgi:MFS family permease
MSRVWRTWLVLILFAIGTSMVTPLIPIYQDRIGFSDTVVTLFLGCYVAALVPSMLSLGQISDRIGRKHVLLGAIATLATAQVLLITEPPLAGLLAARAIQGLATGAFFGTCTAFLVDAAPEGKRSMVAGLGSTSVRLGLGLGPGIGGVLAQYAPYPLQLPFEVHLVALAVAAVIVIALPETITQRAWRPLTLSLGVPAAERAVFWRLLVPSAMLFSLFDAVALSLIPVFIVRKLEITNYAIVGAAGFLVLVSGAVSQLLLPRLPPRPAISWGLAVAAVASVGVVAGSPTNSVPLVLASVAVTGAACGLVFKGGIDLCTQIAPPADRGKLISSYYVACYLGGFSVPLILLGLLADLVGLTQALAVLSVASALGGAWTASVGMRSLKGLEGSSCAPLPASRIGRRGP